MTNATFPTTKGLNWTVRKNPEFSTIEKWNTSGKRVTYANFNDPRWNFELSWDYLRDDQSAMNAAFTDLRAVQGFFGAMKGKFDTWLFEDPDDNSVTNEWFGDGDGSTTSFQLKRSFGGMIENIRNAKLSPKIYANDWQNPTNWLKYSCDFAQAYWSKGNGLNIVPNYAIAPDGSLTADLLTFNPTGTSQTQILTPGSSITSDGATRWTLSLYVMGYANTTTAVFGIRNLTDSTWITSTPTILSGQGNMTGGTTWQVNGLSTTSWTRIQLTMNAAVTAGKVIIPFLYCADAGGSFSVDGAGTLYWGVQFEPRTTASAHVKTTSVAPIGPSQMFSYQRTNLLKYSQDITQASAWSLANCTTSTLSQVDPTGATSTTFALVDSATTTEHYVDQTFASSDNQTAIISTWARAGARNIVYVAAVLRDGATVKGAWFRLNGSPIIGTVDAGVTAYVGNQTPNGWYRLTITVNLGTGASSAHARYQIATTEGTKVYLGSGAGLYLWGAQAEVQFGNNGTAPPSRYIATTTATVSVTDYTLNNSGVVTFAAAPIAGTWASWTGGFYFRCAFVDDMIDAEQFLKKLWELRSLQFRSVSQ